MPFEKGMSGNGQGRPKQTAEQKEQRALFQALLQQATVPALERIIEIAVDKCNRNCFNACRYIIDKAYGVDTTVISIDEPLSIKVIRCNQKDNEDIEDGDLWE